MTDLAPFLAEIKVICLAGEPWSCVEDVLRRVHAAGMAFGAEAMREDAAKCVDRYFGKPNNGATPGDIRRLPFPPACTASAESA